MVKAKERPAETATGVAGAVVAVVSLVFHVNLDPVAVAALVAGVAAVPGIVTTIVSAVRGK